MDARSKKKNGKNPWNLHNPEVDGCNTTGKFLKVRLTIDVPKDMVRVIRHHRCGAGLVRHVGLERKNTLHQKNMRKVH